MSIGNARLKQKCPPRHAICAMLYVRTKAEEDTKADVLLRKQQ